MMRGKWFPWFVVSLVLVISASGIFLQAQMLVPVVSSADGAAQASGELAILTWNDLGMHCYNRDFQDLAVLPPFNTLWVQVVRNGDPPEVVTSGITVSYAFPDNTYSVGKTNFWDYEEMLFGVNLAPNVGLYGKGLSGTMDLELDHYVAVGIPLTEFRDSDLVNRYPYQLATITVRDEITNDVLATTTVVAPTSSEMSCNNCHYDGAINGIATGRVETNILTLHDQENADDYPPGHDTPLMDRRPILCAECHASNALGAPGLPEIPSLSNAMHAQHAGEVTNDLDGCYNCHPGPQTQCLRDVMSQQEGMDCIDCHGNMENVSTNPNPWLNEPRCDNTDCHGSSYALDQPLYRNSSDHGGIYCAACHDSPHAIAPSREANDQIKFINLQGHVGPLDTCTVCHTTQPTDAGPHGIVIPNFSNFLFLPEIFAP